MNGLWSLSEELTVLGSLDSMLSFELAFQTP